MERTTFQERFRKIDKLVKKCLGKHLAVQLKTREKLAHVISENYQVDRQCFLRN